MSVELHVAAHMAQVLPILAGVKFPFMLERLGDREWADRPKIEDATTWGRLEPIDGGTRARLLWGTDSGGMTPTASDWTKLRARLAKAAAEAGIATTEHQGARMRRLPLTDVSALTPQAAYLTKHRWQAVDL